jgi:tRNA threonylcarbamoyl adenosine modification protein YjeE
MKKLLDRKTLRLSKILLDEEETIQFGKELALDLKNNDLIALHGDLGAGKTTLVKGIVSEIAAVERRIVQSPTFTYLNIYETDPPLYHFDLYRLKSAEEFIQMGFLDFFD